MLYQKICKVALGTYAFLSSLTHGSTYYVQSAPSSDYQCPSGTASCHIYCDIATHGYSNNYDCNDADDCYFHCDKKQCGANSVLSAANADNLYITQAADGQQCLQSSNVTTPNNGSAYLSSYAKKGYQGTTLYAGANANEIIIDVSEAKEEKKEDYKGMKIYAATATYFKITLGSHEWNDGVLQCPVDSSYQGPDIAPCSIDATGGELKDMIIEAPYGIPRDVWFHGCKTCSNVQLRCEVVDSLNGLTQTGTSYYPFTTASDCWWTNHPTTDPTNAPSFSPSSAPSAAPSFSPSLAPTFSPSSAPSTAPTCSPTLAPTSPPSSVPSLAPTSAPSSAPSLSPTDVTQSPSAAPTSSPSAPPSAAPSISPTNDPTRAPSVAPSHNPSVAPTQLPSYSPSNAPTQFPTAAPSNAPTTSPSPAPSRAPSVSPSNAPSFPPSFAPSRSPSIAPTQTPTSPPTQSPSVTPTQSPSAAPSNTPTLSPSYAPTQFPSVAPSNAPTLSPSSAPTQPPSVAPSNAPTVSPSTAPTQSPSAAPTHSPTDAPTFAPSAHPTSAPSFNPTASTSNPTNTPSFSPTLSPTFAPSYATNSPSAMPTATPSAAPTASPLVAESTKVLTNIVIPLLIVLIIVVCIVTTALAVYFIRQKLKKKRAQNSKQLSHVMQSSGVERNTVPHLIQPQCVDEPNPIYKEQGKQQEGAQGMVIQLEQRMVSIDDEESDSEDLYIQKDKEPETTGRDALSGETAGGNQAVNIMVDNHANVPPKGELFGVALKNRMEEADAVRLWMRDTVQLPQYTDLLLRNGFDTMDSWTEIRMEDLISFGVMVGHAREIMIHSTQLREQYAE